MVIDDGSATMCSTMCSTMLLTGEQTCRGLLADRTQLNIYAAWAYKRAELIQAVYNPAYIRAYIYTTHVSPRCKSPHVYGRLHVCLSLRHTCLLFLLGRILSAIQS